jgi:hypothetical protein
MVVTYLPRVEDYFPKLRRGHGTTHRFSRTTVENGQTIVLRKANPCVASSCKGDTKSKDTHFDKGANIADWLEERGLKQLPGTRVGLEAIRPVRVSVIASVLSEVAA